MKRVYRRVPEKLLYQIIGKKILYEDAVITRTEWMTYDSIKDEIFAVIDGKIQKIGYTKRKKEFSVDYKHYILKDFL